MATGRLPDPNTAPVTAKGDLYTYSTVPAKLAVGNNGETLVADSSTSTGLRWTTPVSSLANPVINGGFDLWQRGTSFTDTTMNQYTADRWKAFRSSNVSISRQTTGDTTNLPNIQYCARVQRPSGNTNTSIPYLTQSFETVNSIPLAGKTITLSFYARAGSNFSASSNSMAVQLSTGTGTDQQVIDGYTGAANPISQNVTLTTTWQRFAITANIGATATEIALLFYYTPVGTAGTNDFFEFTGVQIDVGTYTASTAPTFRRSGGTLAGELAACQRYYTRYVSGNLYGLMGSGIASNTGSLQVFFPLAVPMRIIPTALDSSAVGTFYWEGGSSNGNTPTSVTIGGSCSAFVAQALVNKTSGFTTGAAYALYGNNSTTAYVGFSAEL